MNERINELVSGHIDPTLDSITVNDMSDADRYNWYLQIKESLPKLRELFSTTEIEKAIIEYERKNKIV